MNGVLNFLACTQFGLVSNLVTYDYHRGLLVLQTTESLNVAGEDRSATNGK